ncbi:MAG: tetratricopeptide repeat protein, partial [Candidatus Sericytochromatia bacterium]|nr:tetratricopeptide repeat protein [Candidatus Tanganyikabacteria bacterium]
DAAFVALSDLVLAISRRGPLVLVVEDTQWADDASAAWMRVFIERLQAEDAQTRLLVVLVGRGTDRYSGLDDPMLVRLQLGPLSEDESLALAAFFLGSTPEALAPRVRETLGATAVRAQGNPFYLTEIVRELADSGALARRGATWELDAAVADFRLPATVHAAVASRLNRLEPRLVQVVQVAAVIGRRFERAMLVAAAALEPGVGDVEEAIGALEVQRVFESTAGGSGEVGFAQPLLQEVAYGSLLEARKRALHRRIGLALEEKMGQGTVRFAATLAQHFSQAGDAERSARYMARAGDRARAAYANVEARACYRAALEWRQRAPESAALPQREDLLLNLASVETALGNYDEANRLLDLRWDVAPETSRALRARGDVLESMGDMAGALAAYRKAILLAANDGLESSRALAAQANVRRRLGDFPEAVAMCQAALSCLAGLGLPSEAAYVHGVMGICYQRIGDLEGALRHHSEAMRLRKEAGDVSGVASSYNNMGAICAAAGRLDEAKAHYSRSQELYRRLGDRPHLSEVLNNLGDLLIKQQDFESAEQHVNEAISLSRKIGYPSVEIAALCNLSLVAQTRDEPATALERLDQALDLVYRTGLTEWIAEIRHMRGRTMAALGRAEDAEHEFAEALNQAASSGNTAL